MSEQRISPVDVAVVVAFILLFAYMNKRSSPANQQPNQQPARTASKSEDTKTARVKSEDRSKQTTRGRGRPRSVKTAREKSTHHKQKPKVADNTAAAASPPLQPLNRTDSNASRNYGDEVLSLQNQPRFGGQDVRVSSVPPEEITTAPSQQVVFNAPFDMQHEYHVRVRSTDRLGHN